MHAAAQRAYALGKGIIAIKVFGGGALTSDPEAALQYALKLPYAHSLVVGMRSVEEIKENVRRADESLPPSGK